MEMKSILCATITLILCLGDGLAFTVIAPQTSSLTPIISYKALVSLPMSSSSSYRNGGENSNSYDSLPSQDEIAKQKSDAYHALSSFHETAASLPMMTTTSSSQTVIRSLLSGLDDELFADETQNIPRPEYWMCRHGAITYAVPMDPAAGLKRGKISKPYRCSVRLEMDIETTGGGGIRRRKRGLRLVESIQHISEEEGKADVGGVPFLRSIPLGENVDVDAADGSYSLDVALFTDDPSTPMVPLLPPSLLGYESDVPMSIQFLVEHTLAVSETERCRCFLLYGDASDDGRGPDSIDDLSAPYDRDDDVNEDDYAVTAAKRVRVLKKVKSENDKEKILRLLSVIFAEETKVMPKHETKDSAEKFTSQLIESSIPSESFSSSSSPLTFSELNETNEIGNDKMNKLIQSLQERNDQVMNPIAMSPDGDNMTMERFSLGMFGLTSGIWLGDTFVRENMPLSLLRARESREIRTKGFEKNKQRGQPGSDEDRFATWSAGVQKVALRFEWDFSKSISLSFTYGKVMGTATSLSSMANIKSDGTIVVNESRPTRKREELRVIWDMDGGAYVAGLIGSFYFRAPRFMSFSQSRTSSADAYLTEFMVFYRTRESNLDVEVSAIPDLYCSRSCRLYNSKNGSLQQGSTSFFSLKRVGPDQ